VFGARWHTAGIYCSFLCPLVLLRVIAFVLGPTLDVIHRQGLRLARESACVILMASGLFMAGWFGWSERASVIVSTLLTTLGYAISIALTRQALVEHHRGIAQPDEAPSFAKAA
jgi:O-antigen/teichoic acid export membrane protein